MEALRRMVARLADSGSSVLISGDTGSGKEMVARALHHLSSRRDAPFLAVNCSALPGTLMESIIFGHERGAFTGAERRVRGHLELAGTGTLLLDEIAEMPLELQAKLLRVLEERRFRPLGAEQEIPFRARVLAATHADLDERLAEGRFREDLFYRLNVVTIRVPPLAARGDDVVELALAFAGETSRKLRFTEDGIRWFREQPWRGNVRELRNVIDRLALLAESDVVDEATLRQLVAPRAGQEPQKLLSRIARDVLAMPDEVGSRLRLVERALIEHAMIAAGDNKTTAARLLRINRKAFARRWDRLAATDTEDDD
jgi:DNA-binding NtrC family response regulator